MRAIRNSEKNDIEQTPCFVNDSWLLLRGEGLGAGGRGVEEVRWGWGEWLEMMFTLNLDP